MSDLEDGAHAGNSGDSAPEDTDPTSTPPPASKTKTRTLVESLAVEQRQSFDHLSEELVSQTTSLDGMSGVLHQMLGIMKGNPRALPASPAASPAARRSRLHLRHEDVIALPRDHARGGPYDRSGLPDDHGAADGGDRREGALLPDPSDDDAREAANALRKVRHARWKDTGTQPHWFLAGAPPPIRNQAGLQAVLGNECMVDNGTYGALTSLSGFDVSKFRPKGAPTWATVELTKRMTIMGQAIVSMAAASLPHIAREPYEYNRCFSRVESLLFAFQAGTDKLKSETVKNQAAAAEPATISLLVKNINNDMEEWSGALLLAAEQTGHNFLAAPPASVDDLPELPVPIWENLHAFLSSNMMSVWHEGNTSSSRPRSTSGTGPGGRGGGGKPWVKSSEPCQRYARGVCKKPANACRYYHPPSGRGGGSSKRKGDSTKDSPGAKKSKPGPSSTAAATADASAGAQGNGNSSE